MILFYFLFRIVSIQCFNISKIVNTELEEFQAQSQSVIRESSESGKLMDEIINFLSTVLKNQPKSLINTYSNKLCPFNDINVKCNDSDYESYDGSCNNLDNPFYGKSNTPFQRYLSPSYDNHNSPRNLAVSGSLLPHIRAVSLAVSAPLPKGVQELETTITEMFAIFGQFLTHDISGTSVTTDINGIELSCPCNSTDLSCMPVIWPTSDPVLNQTCMEFTRSSATFSNLNCSIDYREQLNLLSAYIDGSQIYGNDGARANDLRSFEGGMLKVSSGLQTDNMGLTNRSYLPLANDKCSRANKYNCFLAGEYRTSENLALVTMHTLFNREHNRIANQLALLRSDWNDEKIYFEARSIVIAMVQHIVYSKWLPIISGNYDLIPIPIDSDKIYYTGYDKTINPSLANEFATAAMRMGHSLIRDQFTRLYASQEVIKGKNFDLDEITFKSDYAYDNSTQGLNSILLGLTTDMAWKYGSFGFELQSNLFENGESRDSPLFRAVDLLATNIQRGRDHGLQPYIYYIELCHNISVKSFDDLKPLMSSKNIKALKTVYESVKDIDLYAGGLSEASSSVNQPVGQTFACMIMKQFSDLKNGDRFYYENSPEINKKAFTPVQLREIKKVSLAGVICNNYDLSKLQKNVFMNAKSIGNKETDCGIWKEYLDFTKWFN